MIIYIDESCRPNSGELYKRTMRVVLTDENRILLVDKTGSGGSNNIAELWAFSEALQFAIDCKIAELTIYTDSKNAIAWIEGRIGKKLMIEMQYCN